MDEQQDGITAYHGSPHDFDEFDTSKIGTGEGAQAYGHGLYFAQAEPTAKGYRDALTDRASTFRVGNIDMPKWILRGIENAPDRNAAIEKHRQDFQNRLEEELKEQETSHQPWMSSGRISSHKDILRGLDELQRGSKLPHTKGRMYEVHINAHPHHMLDWDKPLSEQPHVVQQVMTPDTVEKLHAYFKKNDMKNAEPDFSNVSGQRLYEFLGSKSIGAQKGDIDASQHLHSAGIKGIKYLDAGSRGDKAEPTHNYVVFDHNDVRVKRKYERGGRVRFSQGGTDSYDYRGEHQAPGPEDGAPLHDLTKVYPDDVYGPNGFQYYGETGEPYDRANFSLVQSMRGKPNAPVTMYRAVPNVPSVAKELAKLEEDMANYQRRGRLPRDAWTTDKTRWFDSSAHQRDLLREKAEKEKLNPPAEIGINAGDWVTTNRQYAKDHGESALNGNYKILTKKARAKELFTAGDSHHEWGYHPEKKAEGGAVDNDVIPHGDPKREQNLAKHMEGSKTPPVLYHGSDKDINTFNTNLGTWFSEKPKLSNEYASGENGNVYAAHVSIKNPIEFLHAEQRKNIGEIISNALSGAKNLSPDQINKAKSLVNDLREKHGTTPKALFEFWRNDPNIAELFRTLGYDGVSAFEKQNKENKTWAALYPHQIKSATGNNGNFDPSNPDITKADGGEVDDIPDIKNPISVFPKPQRMFPEENRPAGGQYLNAKTKEDMTGHKAAQASIGVQPGGRPFFNASADAVEQTGSHGKGNATAKTNLFKQKAGWKWVEAPEGHEDTGTIVSVEHRGHHHYALNAHFPKGVDLARYENSTSEPRLRPTTKGNVTKGDQVGTISVRGKEHPVYNHVIVKAGGGPIVKRALELLSKDRTGR